MNITYLLIDNSSTFSISKGFPFLVFLDSPFYLLQLLISFLSFSFPTSQTWFCHIYLVKMISIPSVFLIPSFVIRLIF
jgi:hypothetical protein